jgi:hypothetical protein
MSFKCLMLRTNYPCFGGDGIVHTRPFPCFGRDGTLSKNLEGIQLFITN